MKLTTRDIAGFLQARPKVSVVLVYGPDHGLVKERASILGRHVVADLNDAFNTATLAGDQVIETPARFQDEVWAMSMMGGDRLIRITEASDGVTVVLKPYLKAPNKSALVVIEAGDLKTSSSLRKLCEAETNAAALPCYVQEGAELSRVIAATLREANVRIDPDALSFLAGAIGGDHQQVKSEIEKLLTYMGVDAHGRGTGQMVTYDDAVACSGAMGLAALDGFIDRFLTGDVTGAFDLLPRLEEDGVAMIAILRALLAHTRRMMMTHIRISNGENLSEILEGRDAPVFFKRKAIFAQQMKLWPLPRLQQLMNDVLVLEQKMKSGVDPDVVIPQTFLSLCVRTARAA